MGLWYNKKKAYQKKNIDYGAMKKGCIVPELSIIVPVYKVEPYLPKCIDSILSQTFTDFELILIDDGSPDRCGEICEEYAAKDDRIVVIHQANKGVSAARNAGLDIAKGKYIGFVDSDDWIEPEMYEKMVSVSKETNTDIVICGSIQRSVSGEFICKDFHETMICDRQTLLEAFYSIPNPLGGVLWNKMLLRSTIGDTRFRETLRNCEDGVFLAECLWGANSAVKIADSLYNVVQRPFSASRSDQIPRLYDTICGFEEIRKELTHHPYNRKLNKLAVNMVLDNGVRFSNRIVELHNSTGASCDKEIGGAFRIMRKCIALAAFQGYLSLRKIHGYIYEMRSISSNINR